MSHDLMELDKQMLDEGLMQGCKVCESPVKVLIWKIHDKS